MGVPVGGPSGDGEDDAHDDERHRNPDTVEHLAPLHRGDEQPRRDHVERAPSPMPSNNAWRLPNAMLMPATTWATAMTANNAKTGVSAQIVRDVTRIGNDGATGDDRARDAEAEHGGREHKARGHVQEGGDRPGHDPSLRRGGGPRGRGRGRKGCGHGGRLSGCPWPRPALTPCSPRERADRLHPLPVARGRELAAYLRISRTAESLSWNSSRMWLRSGRGCGGAPRPLASHNSVSSISSSDAMTRKQQWRSCALLSRDRLEGNGGWREEVLGRSIRVRSGLREDDDQPRRLVEATRLLHQLDHLLGLVVADREVPASAARRRGRAAINAPAPGAAPRAGAR